MARQVKAQHGTAWHGMARHARNGSRITRQTIGQTGIGHCHCGAMAIVAIVWLPLHYATAIDVSLVCSSWTCGFPTSTRTAFGNVMQQQLVAIVAYFPIELTIAVRLLTVTICPIAELCAGGLWSGRNLPSVNLAH